MQVLSRFKPAGAIVCGLYFVQMTLWLAALILSCARVQPSLSMTLVGIVGGVFTAAGMGYAGWATLSCLLRCPALWVEEGDLVWLAAIPSRVRLNDIVSYKFQRQRHGERTSIRGVRLFMRDGRKVFVSLYMLDGAEAVIACLRRHVPNAGQVTMVNLDRLAVI